MKNMMVIEKQLFPNLVLWDLGFLYSWPMVAVRREHGLNDGSLPDTTIMR